MWQTPGLTCKAAVLSLCGRDAWRQEFARLEDELAGRTGFHGALSAPGADHAARWRGACLTGLERRPLMPSARPNDKIFSGRNIHAAHFWNDAASTDSRRRRACHG